MADFCNQCKIELQLGESGDPSDYETGRPACDPGTGHFEICEGCGFTLVDHKGNCLGVCETGKHKKPASSNLPEPTPTPNQSTPIWELVIADMRERDHLGRQKYKTPLQAFNGRDPMVDAYQEVLDLAVYLRQAIEERQIAKNHETRRSPQNA